MKTRFVYIVLLCLTLALVLGVRRGATQSTGDQPRRARARAGAIQILQSPMAKYLSGSGQNALNLIANPPDLDLRASIATKSRATNKDVTAQLLSHEIMVNDPSRDDVTDARDLSTQSQTALASYGDTVLVAYNDSGQYFNQSLMGYSRSTDGGLTFIDMDAVPAPPGGLNTGAPGLAVDRAGNFYISSMTFDFSGARPPGIENAIGIYKSTDGGQTLQPPVYVPPINSTQIFADKPFITTDTSSNPATAGNIYVSYTHFGGGSSGSSIAFSRSTDGGASFSTPILLSSPNDAAQGSEPIVGRNGEVYVVWLRQFSATVQPPAIFFAKSTDGGQSFGPARRIATLATIGFGLGTLTGGFRVNSYPRVDVGDDGNIYVVYAANMQGADGADVFLTRSTDGGTSWPIPIKVNSQEFGGGSESLDFFPDVAVNRVGTVHVIWYSNRVGPIFGGGRIDQSISVQQAESFDLGRSFGVESSVTSSGFSPVVGHDLAMGPSYMGDYLDLKTGFGPAGRDNRFLMAWGDCRRIITTIGGTRPDQDVIFSAIRPFF
jgi:hypothetical protein